MKKINENMKVTLTFGQLKKLIKEASEDLSDVELDPAEVKRCFNWKISDDLKATAREIIENFDWPVIRKAWFGHWYANSSGPKLWLADTLHDIDKEEHPELHREWHRSTRTTHTDGCDCGFNVEAWEA